MTAASVEAGERKDVPDKYKWNLADLYPSEAAWTKAKDALAKRAAGAGEVPGAPGQVAQGAAGRAADDVRYRSRAVAAVGVRERPVRRGRPGGAPARDEAGGGGAGDGVLGGDLLGAPGDPDAGPRQGAQAGSPQEPKLAPYRVYLEETLRRKPHTLGAAEEQVVAEAGEMERAGGEVHGVLSNADLPYPTIKLSTGESVRLDASAFTLHRQARVRADRDKVFASFFGALKTYERTMGATLAAAVKAHLFEKRVRQFDTGAGGGAVPGQHPDRPSTSSCSPTCTAACRRCIATWRCASGCWAWTPCATRTCTCRWSRASTCASRPTRRGPSRWTRWRRSGKAYTDALQQGLRQPLDRLPAVDGEAVGRLLDRRVRRAPVSAAELQRALRRPDDAGARVGALDAHVPVARGAALPDRRLPDLRRRGGVDVQREPADSLHARPRQGRRRPGCSCWARCWTGCGRRCSGRRSSPSSSWRFTSRPSAASR